MDTGPYAIKIQSETEKSGLVIQAKQGASVEPQLVEVDDVTVDGRLLVELVPEDPSRLPILSGIEVTRKE